ncbi:MAG: AAA family ATPase [Myxococcota bacterium]
MTLTSDDQTLLHQPRALHLPKLPIYPFFGRQKAIDELRRSIQDEGVRSIALVGPPGVGKTRLLLELSTRMVNNCGWHGIWFCDLDGVRSEREVLERIAGVVGLSLGQNATLDDLKRGLRRNCPALLLLDGLERFDDDAVEFVRQLADWKEEDIRLLMTTRDAKPLHSFAEQVLEVSPLSVEGADESGMTEAGRLLLDRARVWLQGKEPSTEESACLEEIAQRLEGLPLALELAAARLAILDPAEIIERLDQSLKLLSFPGAGAQVSLRIAIDTSWELLSDSSRMALAQCALFPDRFDVHAAEAIVSLPEGGESVLDALHGLFERSLLQRVRQGRQGYYRLLTSIREYGLEKLDEMGIRSEVEARFVSHYAKRTDALRERLWATMDPDAFEELSSLVPHLRVVIEVGLASTDIVMRRHVISATLGIAMLLHRGNVLDVEAKLKLVVDYAEELDATDPELQVARGRLLIELWLLARLRGHRDQRHHWLARASAWAEAHDNPSLRAWVWRSEAAELWSSRNPQEADARVEQAMAEARRAGDRVLEARASAIRTVLLGDAGQHERALELSRTVVQTLEEEGAGLEHILEQANYGLMLYQLGAVDGALEVLEAIVTTLTEANYMSVETVVRRQLISCLTVLGRTEQAREHIRRCIWLSETTAMPGALAYIKADQGLIALMHEHDPKLALELLREAVEIRRGEGNRRLLMFTLKDLATVQIACGDFQGAVNILNEAIKLSQVLQTRNATVELLCLLAVSRARIDEPDQARALLAQAKESAAWGYVGLKLDTHLVALLLGDPDAAKHACDVMEEVLTPVPPPAGAPGPPRPSYQRSRSLKYCAQRLYETLEPKDRAAVWSKVCDPTLHGLVSTGTGRFRLPGGRWLELASKKTLCRIMDALVELRITEGPDATLSQDDCLEAGWPNETIVHDAATNRLYQVISRLRRSGFKALLVVGDEGGYHLKPDIDVFKVPHYLP